MRTSFAVAVAFGALSTLIACSSSDGGKDAADCSTTPTAKGCKKPSSAGEQSSSGGTMTAPAQAAPPPALPQQVADAGADARPRKPDGGSTVIPQPDVACRDLLRCCQRVQDTIERAACYAVGYKASASNCANAIIAYQVFGGCNHDPFELPDIFNNDGSENQTKSCEYLENACARDPSYCDQAYQCNGVSVGSGSGSASEACSGLDDTLDSCGRSVYSCCQLGGFYCEEWGSYCDLPMP